MDDFDRKLIGVIFVLIIIWLMLLTFSFGSVQNKIDDHILMGGDIEQVCALKGEEG